MLEFPKDQQIISIDIGTTKVKVVKYKHEQCYFEKYNRDEMDKVIARAIEKDYNAILLTGSGAGEIHDEMLYHNGQSIPTYHLNELECVANIVKYQGHETGLVINIGTGTSFLYYNKGEFEHISGTGIGGGTFMGLSERLLGIHEPKEVEELAMQGKLENINLVIRDIYKEKLGWLQDDITVANFQKGGKEPEDIALGIHSIVIEPIMSIAKGITHFLDIDTIYFTGGVMNNQLAIKLVEKYAHLFKMAYNAFENPSYGTALGALEVYRQKQSQIN